MSGKCALLVIDMLNDFIDPGGSLYCGRDALAIIEPLKSRISDARREGVPVIYICDRHLPGDREFEMFPPHCVAGTWGASIHPALEPAETDRMVPKRRFSAFFGTDLDVTLREMGIGELVVTGVCTNICVLYTTADARMRGYDVKVAADSVASFDQNAHQFALEQMRNVLRAEVIS